VHSLIGAVPDDWRHAKLADVCSIVAGPSGTRLRLERRTSANIPVITPQNLQNSRITEDGDSAVSVEQATSLSRYQVRSMDIVVARTGVLGRQGLASEEQEGWLIGTGCLRLRPEEPLGARYLNYYLCHPSVHDWIISNGVGSAISTLTTKTLGALPVVIPPTKTQTAIAATLCALDEKIAIHEQIVQTTVALREAVTPLLFAGLSDIESART
jgi:restriction endonuclease S subunit